MSLILMAGEFGQDKVYCLFVCVYYEDMDFFGVVYYVCYFYFFECGWIDSLCSLGIYYFEFVQVVDFLVFVVC